MTPNVVDLFAGAGGLSHGFENAGFDILAGIDIEQEFIKSFEEQHDQTKGIVADLSEEKAEELLKQEDIHSGDVDVVIGGPPCKGFSTVGDREEDDERNQLVREFAHAVDALQPKVFLMENVTGLRSMEDENGDKVIDTLIEMFENYGYTVKYGILKASDYGVPQHRKRLFMIGMKNASEFSFPEKTHGSKGNIKKYSSDLKDYITVEDAISDLPNLSAGEVATEYIQEPETDYQRKMRNGQEELLNHKTPNHSDKIIERLEHVPQGGNHRDLPERLQLSSGYPNIYGRLDPEKPADTITANFGTVSAPGKFINPWDDRALTVREGARLQSFPDSYRFYGNQSEQYKQVGHAVPPLLAEHLAEEISELL